jgi:hypothetical protein
MDVLRHRALTLEPGSEELCSGTGLVPSFQLGTLGRPRSMEDAAWAWDAYRGLRIPQTAQKGLGTAGCGHLLQPVPSPMPEAFPRQKPKPT